MNRKKERREKGIGFDRYVSCGKELDVIKDKNVKENREAKEDRGTKQNREGKERELKGNKDKDVKKGKRME